MGGKMFCLSDELTGALIGLAKACINNPRLESTTKLLMEGLVTAGNGESAEELASMTGRVQEEKYRIVPNCRSCTSVCGNTSDYDLREIWDSEEEEVRSLKSRILSGIKDMAPFAYQAMILGYEDRTVNDFLYRALAIISYDLEAKHLLPLASETETMEQVCIELLKNAEAEVKIEKTE